MARRRWTTALLVMCIVLAGCSGGGVGAGGDAAESEASLSNDDAASTARAESTASRDGGGDAGSSGGSAQSAGARSDRAIIKTGRIALTVNSFASKREQVGTLARGTGGYVATSSREVRGEGNRTWTVGVVRIRVPSEEFTATHDEITTYGEVRDASQETNDVTDQLVDIEARLRTLRAERDRLRQLYDEANDTEAVLRVSEQLSEVQTEIERLEARKKSLQDRVAYSTITVELREEPPERETPTPEPGYTDTSLGTAFLASVNGVVTAVEAVAVTIAYALPYLLVFGVPLGGLGVVVVRRRL